MRVCGGTAADCGGFWRQNRVVESIYVKLKVHGKARLGEFVF